MGSTGASGGGGHSRLSRLLRSPSARLSTSLLVVGILLTIDVAGGQQVWIGALMVAVPALSAVFLTPGAVLLVAVVTTGAVVVAVADDYQSNTGDFYFVITTVVLISAGAVAAAAVRLRREHQLAQVRWVAAVVQRVLLRPLPARLGPLTLSSMYLAAEEEAAIGGDLYAVAALDDGDARLIVGDVQGKGLGAVEVAGFLLTAFRRAARKRIPLRDLPAYLDSGLREDMADLSEPIAHRPGAAPAPDRGTGALEGFVTAVMVDVGEGGRTVSVVNCGHPPPLLIRRRTVLSLLSASPGLPLGLGDLCPDSHHVDAYALDVGDILLLYTDGVIETRDAAGIFYPLAERLPDLPTDTLDVLLRAVGADLQRHAAARLGDDVAMVAVQRVV
jgi:hypothetical protein